MCSVGDCNCVHTSLNPADVGTRKGIVRNSDPLDYGLENFHFFYRKYWNRNMLDPFVVVCSDSIDVDLLSLENNKAWIL